MQDIKESTVLFHNEEKEVPHVIFSVTSNNAMVEIQLVQLQSVDPNAFR